MYRKYFSKDLIVQERRHFEIEERILKAENKPTIFSLS